MAQAQHGLAPAGMCCSSRSKGRTGATIRNVHDGEGKNWREAFCSWCYEETVHYHIAQTQSWLCDACKGRTVESPSSSDCMARLEGRKVRAPTRARPRVSRRPLGQHRVWGAPPTRRERAACCRWSVRCFWRVLRCAAVRWRWRRCLAPMPGLRRCLTLLVSTRRQGRRIVCAKAEPQWQQILARKRQVLAEDRTVNQVKYEMTRESATRQLAAKAGMLRPFVLLVSMTPSLRALLAVQLGLSPLSQPSFGDPHEEAWQILSHKVL